jgi:hypothetical protein
VLLRIPCSSAASLCNLQVLRVLPACSQTCCDVLPTNAMLQGSWCLLTGVSTTLSYLQVLDPAFDHVPGGQKVQMLPAPGVPKYPALQHSQVLKPEVAFEFKSHIRQFKWHRLVRPGLSPSWHSAVGSRCWGSRFTMSVPSCCSMRLNRVGHTSGVPDTMFLQAAWCTSSRASTLSCSRRTCLDAGLLDMGSPQEPKHKALTKLLDCWTLG